MTRHQLLRVALFVLGGSAVLWAAGCGRSEEPGLSVVTNPQAAASQLEAAFEQAPESARVAAQAAAAAIRQKDYEKAVGSLQVARAAGEVTMAQGVAVHSSMVALEGELLAAAQGGDPKARQAYQLLRAMKSK